MNATSVRHRGFTLIEAVVSMVVVALMFTAGLAAAGAAARDRRTQTDLRLGQQLARELMTEICQQRYADPSANTIAPFAGISTTDRSNWTHIDDYAGFGETPPRDRSGAALTAKGWKWQSSVSYATFASFGGNAASGSGGSGLLGGLLGGVAGIVGAVLGTGGATDTGLKQITVTVTSPSGKVVTLSCLRCSSSAVDRVSTGTGFRSWAGVTMTVGSDQRPVQCGAPLLNMPAMP
jgi:prepilin-type N-terminal cleavage/methylation domain-containing protein